MVKKGLFTVTTKHTSESHYYGLVCPVEDLKAGKQYKLVFEMNCEGEGMVNICARTTKKEGRKKSKKKGKGKASNNKLVTLGLVQKGEKTFSQVGKKYTCEFTATENPNSDQIPAIKVLIGEFKVRSRFAICPYRKTPMAMPVVKGSCCN